MAKQESPEPKIYNDPNMDMPVLVKINQLTALDFDQMQNILPYNNVTKFLILKKEYSQCNMVHDNAVIQYDNIAEQASNDPSFRDREDRAKRQVDKLAKELIRIEQEIRDLDRKANIPFTSFTPLKNPIYGPNEIIEPTKLQFLPKINANSSSKVSTLWQSLTVLIESLGLSEDAARNCLMNRLEGEPFEVFHLYRLEPLIEIVKHLVRQFDRTPNRSKYIQDIKKFSRQEHETIMQAMTRLKTYLKGAENYRRIEDKRLPEQNILEDYLQKSVSAPTWEKATAVEKHCIRHDISFTIDQLIEECEKVEQTSQSSEFTSFPLSLHSQELQSSKDKNSSPKSPRRATLNPPRFSPYPSKDKSDNRQTDRPFRRPSSMSPNRSRDGSLQVGRSGSLGYRIGNPPNDQNSQRNQFVRQDQNRQDTRNMQNQPNQSFTSYPPPKQNDYNFSPRQNYQPVYRRDTYQRPQQFNNNWQSEPRHNNYTHSGQRQAYSGYGQQ